MNIYICLYLKSNRNKKKFLIFENMANTVDLDLDLNLHNKNINSNNLNDNNFNKQKNANINNINGNNNKTHFFNKTQMIRGRPPLAKFDNINPGNNNNNNFEEGIGEEESFYDSNYIPNFYLFENEVLSYPYDGNNSVKLLMFQNYLKLYTLYNFSKTKVKLKANLNIENFFEFSKNFLIKDGRK